MTAETPLTEAWIATTLPYSKGMTREERIITDFARSLERDLTAAREQIAALTADRDKALEDSRKWCDDFTKLEPELRRMVEFAEQCMKERDAARARVAELEAGLRELADAEDAAYPSAEHGVATQDDWAERIEKAHARARALLAPSPEPQP